MTFPRFEALCIVAVGVVTQACGGPPPQTPATGEPTAMTGAAPPARAAAPTNAPTTPSPSAGAGTPKPPLDASRVAAATGGKPETSDGVVKVSFPRDDIPVTVDSWKLPPFMGITSWAAFTAAEKAGVEAMVMGDLVLFADEVNAAMSAALGAGLEVTALHNHFFFDKPNVYFMHIAGEGTIDDLGKAVKGTLDAQRAVRKKAAFPAATFGAPPRATSSIDSAKLDAIFGRQGQSKDGMYKATMGRKAQAACGCTVGKAMGVNTWAAFGGTDDDAVVDGDFAVTEDELQPVLKALRAGGINVVAIHSHMTKETPRILFLHYWGRGRATELAGIVRRAIDLTAWDGKSTST